MSQTYISAELRRLVIERAGRACEYCLVHENDALFGCEVDHIISEKHGGPTTIDNLAYACGECNHHKGSDVGSFVPPLHAAVICRFFNPRTDRWSDHFSSSPFDNAAIIPKSDIGIVTERIFRFNDAEPLAKRAVLARFGR